MIPPIQPGTVESLSPFRVHLEGDPPEGLPCQQVGPASVDHVGAVLVSGGQRVWLGAYHGDGGGGDVAWSDVTGKPTAFPPEAHTHTIAQVTDLQATLDGKANTSHTHTMAQVTGLTSLAARVDALEADTGWQNLSLLSGFTAGPTGCQYRIHGGKVHLRGLVTRTAGNFGPTFTTVATLPSAARPDQTTDSYPSMTRTDGNLALVAVTASGNVNAASNNATDRIALSAIAPFLTA